VRQQQGEDVEFAEDDLYTRGREDVLFHSFTHKDRIKKYQVANNGVRMPASELKKETKELESIRQSRQNVGCTCKPANQLSTIELKKVLAKYGLSTNGNRKTLQARVKEMLLARCRESPFGQLLQKNKKSSKKSNVMGQCCWDDTCECVRSGISCHDNGPCGCLEQNKACNNPNGQYTYKAPHYPKKILQEWLQAYSDVTSDNDDDTEISRSSNFQTSSGNEDETPDNESHSFSEHLSEFVLG